MQYLDCKSIAESGPIWCWAFRFVKPQ